MERRPKITGSVEPDPVFAAPLVAASGSKLSRLRILERHGWRTVLVLGLLISVAGCVRETNVNGELVYQYELWVPLAAILAGLIATPIGWLLRERSVRFGWGLVVIGPIATAVVAPSLFQDRVAVSEQGFHIRTGIWGLTSVHSVQFDDVKEIRISAETTLGRRGRHTNYYLNCDHKSGGSSKVPINNAVCEAAAGAILMEAAVHEIPVRDTTGSQ